MIKEFKLTLEFKKIDTLFNYKNMFGRVCVDFRHTSKFQKIFFDSEIKSVSFEFYFMIFQKEKEQERFNEIKTAIFKGE